MVRLICDRPDDYDDNARVSEYEYDTTNQNDMKIMSAIEELIDSSQPTCSNCIHCYRDGGFSSWSALTCKIHGCLEWIHHEHYDLDGSKCPDYKRKE